MDPKITEFANSILKASGNDHFHIKKFKIHKDQYCEV